MQKPFDRRPPSPYDPERYARHHHCPYPPHHGPHGHHEHEHFRNDPLTRETTKVAELKDKFGNTRFKIALTDFDNPEYPYIDDLQKWDTFFLVTVVSFCCNGKDRDNTIILYEERFEGFDEALKKFNELIEQYRVLLNAETKGWQDITAYSEKINFRKIDPDCCRNCIWAKPLPHQQQLFSDWKKHHTRLVCMNPEIAKIENDFQPREPDHQIDPRHPYADRRHRNNDHFYHEERKHFDLDLSPYTYSDGICDCYQRCPDND